MELINHTQNCKLLLIEEILKTNNNFNFFTIYDNKKKLANIINKFKGENFYKILVYLNHNNYVGYFSQNRRHELIRKILNNDDIFIFFQSWLEDEIFNPEIMYIEIVGLNLLLEKLILSGNNINILDKLEDYKIYFFDSTTQNLKNKFYKFKNKIITRDGKTRDIYDTLKSILNNNHDLVIKDLVYIKNYYQDELDII